MTITLKLHCVHETDAARLYQRASGARQWVPRSVCKSVFKHSAKAGEHPIHEVEIEDWWLRKNPWPEGEQFKFKI